MTTLIAPERKSFRNGVQFAWDSTSLSDFKTCPRKYQLSIIQGWSGKGINPHLHFGTLFHYGLELIDHWSLKGPITDDEICNMMRAVLERAGERDAEGTFTPWFSDHKAKNLESLIRSLVWYCDQYHADPFQVTQLSDGTAAVELSFSFDMDGEIQYCGHLDKLGEMTGSLYFLDRKTTTGYLNERYFDQFSPNLQMTGYAFAAQVVLGRKVVGGIIDAAQIGTGFTRFARHPFRRTQDQLDEWHHDALFTIKLARQMTQADYFPLNETACTMYGGCKFVGICSLSPSHRDNFLEAGFVQARFWDPLAEKGEASTGGL